MEINHPAGCRRWWACSARDTFRLAARRAQCRRRAGKNSSVTGRMPAQLRGSSIDLYSKSTAATNKPVVTGNRRMDSPVLCPWFLGVDFRRLPRMARDTLDKAALFHLE